VDIRDTAFECDSKIVLVVWWAFFAIVGWAVSCHVTTHWFWVEELGLAWLQQTPSQLVHKLEPLC